MMAKIKKPHIPRILALDLMRGWFLIVIILNHFSYFPNGFAIITGDSRLFVSAAEGFFIVSGIVLGIVRGAKIVDAPFKTVAKLLLNRSFTLYLTSCIITAISIFISWQFIGNDGVKSPIPSPDTNHFLLAWNIITLQEFYGWADYLRLYAIFIFFSVVFMWLLRRGWWFVGLGICVIIWLLAPRPISMMTQPITWQLLFFLSLTIGYYIPKITSWWQKLSVSNRKRLTFSLMGIFFLTLALNIVSEFITPPLRDGLSQAINSGYSAIKGHMSKNDLNIGRLLLSFIWFAGFFILFRKYEKPITKFFGWILLPFGTNSLYVYSIHAFVVLALHLMVNPQYGLPASHITSIDRVDEIPYNMALSLSGLAVIFLAVKTKFLMKIIPR